MIRACVVVLPLLIVAAPAAPALAQGTLAKKVTIDVNAATPVAVFTAVATASGSQFTVAVDPAVTEPVDITIRNVTVKTALNAICESIGCQWTLTGSRLVVKPGVGLVIGVLTPPGSGPEGGKARATAASAQVVLDALKQKLPSDLNFKDAPLDVVNARLSEVLKMKVELVCKDPGVKTISLDFGNRSLQAALQALGQQGGTQGTWRLTVGPQADGTQTPSIAIMVGSKPVKK